MADSGVISTPEAALERIVAVEIPVRAGRLVGAGSLLPTIIMVVLVLLVLAAAATMILPLVYSMSSGRPPGMMFPSR